MSKSVLYFLQPKPLDLIFSLERRKFAFGVEQIGFHLDKYWSIKYLFVYSSFYFTHVKVGIYESLEVTTDGQVCLCPHYSQHHCSQYCCSPPLSTCRQEGGAEARSGTEDSQPAECQTAANNLIR